MRDLNFNDGLVTYIVNGGYELRFNPTDNEFVNRLFSTFDGLAKQQETGENDLQQYQGDGAKLFDLFRQRDREMRGKIDEIFGAPVCEHIFPNVSVYALADGLPLWANFLLAVIDEIDIAIAEEQKKTNPRVEAYMAKYAKYRR